MKGKISIIRDSRYHIILKIIDETSGAMMLEAEMTPEVFGLVVTGLGYQDCDFKLFEVEKAGKRREQKVIELPFSSHPSLAEVRAAAKVYEVDGWMCIHTAMHKLYESIEKPGNYDINFERFVDAQS